MTELQTFKHKLDDILNSLNGLPLSLEEKKDLRAGIEDLISDTNAYIDRDSEECHEPVWYVEARSDYLASII